MNQKERSARGSKILENISGCITTLFSFSSPEAALNRIVQKRQAEKPVFFPDPREALALAVLPANEFALHIAPNEFEGFHIVGAVYDCLRLKDTQKAGEFLEILNLATDGDEAKTTQIVSTTIAFRIRMDQVSFEDQEYFLAFCRGYGVKNLTRETVEADLEKMG